MLMALPKKILCEGIDGKHCCVYITSLHLAYKKLVTNLNL